MGEKESLNQNRDIIIHLRVQIIPVCKGLNTYEFITVWEAIGKWSTNHTCEVQPWISNLNICRRCVLEFFGNIVIELGRIINKSKNGKYTFISALKQINTFKIQTNQELVEILKISSITKPFFWFKLIVCWANTIRKFTILHDNWMLIESGEVLDPYVRGYVFSLFVSLLEIFSTNVENFLWILTSWVQLISLQFHLFNFHGFFKCLGTISFFFDIK